MSTASARLTGSNIQWKASRISQQKIIFQQGSISLHVYLMIRQRLVQAGWQLLDSTAYSPDIGALFGFPLILVFTKFFSGKIQFPERLFKKMKSFGRQNYKAAVKKWQTVVGQKVNMVVFDIHLGKKWKMRVSFLLNNWRAFGQPSI